MTWCGGCGHLQCVGNCGVIEAVVSIKGNHSHMGIGVCINVGGDVEFGRISRRIIGHRHSMGLLRYMVPHLLQRRFLISNEVWVWVRPEMII